MSLSLGAPALLSRITLACRTCACAVLEIRYASPDTAEAAHAQSKHTQTRLITVLSHPRHTVQMLSGGSLESSTQAPPLFKLLTEDIKVSMRSRIRSRCTGFAPSRNRTFDVHKS